MTPAGLEPAIPGSVGRCLIHWATGPDAVKAFKAFRFRVVPSGRRVRGDDLGSGFARVSFSIGKALGRGGKVHGSPRLRGRGGKGEGVRIAREREKAWLADSAQVSVCMGKTTGRKF